MEDDDPFIMFRFITLILTTSSVLLFFFIMHDAFFVKSQKSGGKDLFVVDRVSNVRDYYWMMMTRFLFFFLLAQFGLQTFLEHQFVSLVMKIYVFFMM